MGYGNENLTELYAAIALPIAILYLLVFVRILTKKTSYNRYKYVVSTRDAAIATLALDFAAISDAVPIYLNRVTIGVTVLIVVLIATLAHLVALQLMVRRSDELTHALEKIEPNNFASRLSSLYIATILLLTNGTTLVAVLELVRMVK